MVMDKSWNITNWPKVMEFCDQSWNVTNFAPMFFVTECKIWKRDGHGKSRNGHGKIICQVCVNPDFIWATYSLSLIVNPTI